MHQDDSLSSLDLISIIPKCKHITNERYEDLSFLGTDKDTILAIFNTKSKCLQVDIDLWKQIARELGIEKIDGRTYYLIQNEAQSKFKSLLEIDALFCRELRKIVINKETHTEGNNLFFL